MCDPKKTLQINEKGSATYFPFNKTRGCPCILPIYS